MKGFYSDSITESQSLILGILNKYLVARTPRSLIIKLFDMLSAQISLPTVPDTMSLTIFSL